MVGPVVNVRIQSTVTVLCLNSVLRFFTIIQLITYPLTSLILRYPIRFTSNPYSTHFGEVSWGLTYLSALGYCRDLQRHILGCKHVF